MALALYHMDIACKYFTCQCLVMVHVLAQTVKTIDSDAMKFSSNYFSKKKIQFIFDVASLLCQY